MKLTTQTPTTGSTGQATRNVAWLEQQGERARQTAALGEQLFALAQAHTPVLGLHQQTRTTFAFQHGQNRRAKTLVEAVALNEVSLTAKRITPAQANAVLAILLRKRSLMIQPAGATNAERAAWAEDAADVYAAAALGDETFRSVGAGERGYVLRDLLASMMHVAAAEGLDWDEIVSRATMHWQAQVGQARASEAPVATQHIEECLAHQFAEQEYTQQRAVLLAQKAAIEADIMRIISTGCTDEYTGLNERHDAVYDLQVKLNDLDDAWNTRMWTATDHAAYRLIINNVD